MSEPNLAVSEIRRILGGTIVDLKKADSEMDRLFVFLHKKMGGKFEDNRPLPDCLFYQDEFNGCCRVLCSQLGDVYAA